MRFPQGAEWLIILVLILVLFGAKKMPEAARGLGRSLRILKAETKGLHDDDEPKTAQVENAALADDQPSAIAAPPVVSGEDPNKASSASRPA